MLHIAFRVDSSYEIGIGHVMRCLTLAKEIDKQLHAEIYFFSRANPGNINDKIVSAGFHIVQMEVSADRIEGKLKHSAWLGKTPTADAEEFLSYIKRLKLPKLDCLVIDHYGIDSEWEKLVKDFSKKVFVIDDLGDRSHDCDHLLDQTFHCPNEKYSTRVPSYCELMLGTEYALLRDEFRIKFPEKEQAYGSVGFNLLVMFGGTDMTNLTLKSLTILSKREDINDINVILGPSAMHLTEVQQFCETHRNVYLHISPSNIAEMMSRADLAIGAAGTTSWERCALRLPSIVVIQADNQREIAKELENEKVITCLEEQNLNSNLNDHLTYWLKDKKTRKIASNKCASICDAMGANRVVNKLFKQ